MKNICIILFLGLVFYSCSDPYKDTIYKAYDELPLATYLKSRPQNFSMWSSVIERAGLFNTLNLQTSNNNTYTCFVPDNDAVLNYLQSKGLSNVEGLSVEEAGILVKYHSLRGVAYTQSMFTSGVISYPTITDDNLSLEFRNGGLNAIYLNNIARLVEINDTVTNGVIHVIDKVLIPITETVSEKLENGRYTIFNQAIIATGYKDSLKIISKEILDSYGDPIIKKFKYTVFAVSDSVFNLKGINTLKDLTDTLKVSATDYTSTSNGLNKYVAYHILGQTKSYSDLSDFPSGTTSMNINAISSDLIALSEIYGTLFINYNSIASKGILFVKTDNNCKNGVIHEVNDYMPVTIPPRTKVIWDLADYPDMASVCAHYQSASLTSTYNLEITDGLVSGYKWKSVPETRTGAVNYRNSKKSGETVGFSANNHDQLRLSLGASGWIELASPKLLAGKYSVKLTYISPVSTTNTSIMLCSMDGIQLGNQLVTSNITTEQLKTSPLLTSFEFTETKQHVLRIISIDGNTLALDYITFEPVN